MKAVLLAGVFALVSSVGALAEDKREELLDQLLKPSEMQAMSRTYMTQYAKEFLGSWKVTLQPLDAATEEVLLKEFTHRLTKDDMDFLPSLRQIYLRHLTQEELQAMVEFYNSPLGKSIAAKTKLMDEEIAKIYYPGINDKAIKHWNDAVHSLRAAGNKL